MAATVAVLGTSVFNTTAGNKTITATPTNGDLIVIVAAASGVATTMSDNATGGTYTQVGGTRTGFSTTGNLQMFVRDNLVTGAASTIYTATQTSSTGGGFVILRVTGMTLTGAAAVRSSGGQSTVAAGTPAPVLSLTPLAGNPIITAMGNTTSTSTTNVVQRTGYTEDFDNGYNTPPTGLEVSHRASGETSATLTYGGATASQFASIAIELAFDTAPTVALNTPADTATGVSTTPELDFTGTDADSDTITYQTQVDTVDTFDSSGVVLQDSFTTVVNTAIFGEQNSESGIGQSFTPSISYSLTKIEMNLKKNASPTDNLVVDIASSLNGPSLATSNTVAGSSLTTSYAYISFTFATPLNLSAGTLYYIRLTRSGAVDATNNYNTEGTASAGYAGGARLILNTGTWTTDAWDINFKASGSAPFIDATSASGGHDAAQFVDITNGAHTDPFTSGEQIGFTVPVGETLSASTVYYWRVRGLDPSGTNTYGGWATTRSFTTASAVSTLPLPVIKLQAVKRSGTY